MQEIPHLAIPLTIATPYYHIVNYLCLSRAYVKDRSNCYVNYPQSEQSSMSNISLGVGITDC